MQKDEHEQFCNLIKSNFAAMNPYAPEIKIESLRLWWVDLRDYPLNAIEKAFELYRKSGETRFPTSGKIIEEMNSHDGRPGAEQAWAIIKPIIHDEEISVIVTIDMQQAFPAAHGLGNDQIGARMAFLEAYRRIVEQERQSRNPVKWILWMGLNKDLMVEQALKGLSDGRLTKKDVVNLLPASDSKDLRLVDLVRTNINLEENNLPSIEDLRTLKEETLDERSLFQKRTDVLKNSLITGEFNGIDFIYDQEIIEELKGIVKRNAAKDEIKKVTIKPIRIISESKNLTPEEILKQFKTPQPAGTLSINLDGEPEEWIKEDD